MKAAIFLFLLLVTPTPTTSLPLPPPTHKYMRAAILIYLLLATPTTSVPPPREKFDVSEFTPGFLNQFTVNDLDKRYVDMYNVMKNTLERIKAPDFDIKNPVMTHQVLTDPPPYWLMQLLFGRRLDHTFLAIRSDNLYLSGFVNTAGRRFSFKDKKFPIPGSTILRFSGTYKSLLGSYYDDDSGPAWPNLIRLDLSRDAVLKAIQVMSNYDPAKTPDSAIKLALATIIVVFIEAQRFPHIRQKVIEAWGTSNGGILGERGAFLVVNWKRISCAILIWSNDKDIWDSKEVLEIRDTLGITTPEEAKAAIWPVLRAKGCSENYEKVKKMGGRRTKPTI